MSCMVSKKKMSGKAVQCKMFVAAKTERRSWQLHTVCSGTLQILSYSNFQSLFKESICFLQKDNYLIYSLLLHSHDCFL